MINFQRFNDTILLKKMGPKNEKLFNVVSHTHKRGFFPNALRSIFDKKMGGKIREIATFLMSLPIVLLET